MKMKTYSIAIVEDDNGESTATICWESLGIGKYYEFDSRLAQIKGSHLESLLADVSEFIALHFENDVRTFEQFVADRKGI